MGGRGNTGNRNTEIATYRSGDWLDSGYVSNKTKFEELKLKWKSKEPRAIVKRDRTDTKGLIMYHVEYL